MPASAQDVLNGWLPGGVSGVYAICLDQSDFDNLHAGIRREFPGVTRYQAVNCRNGLKTLDDFAALPFPVARHTQMAVVYKEPQDHLRDIVTPGPIGCSQSHLSVWRDSQHLPGWIVVFESDVRAVATLRSFLVEAAKEPLPRHNAPGIVKLGWLLRHGGVTPVARNMWALTDHKSDGAQAYAIRCSVIPQYLSALTPIDGHIDVQMAATCVRGLVPPIWQTTKNVCYQFLLQNKASMHPSFSLRLLLPKQAVPGNVVIILPWVLLLACLAIIAGLAIATYKHRAARPTKL